MTREELTMIRVSIVGSTGYTGGELLRYLVRHPEVTIAHLTSESFVGQPIHQIHKFLKGRLGLVCEKLNTATIANDSDVAFLGLPHGAAAKTVAALLEKGPKVIDLSADFRLRDAKVYKAWYGHHAAPHLLKEAVYGLPERYRDQIRTARLVANPGCYATTSILAGLPLVARGLLGKGPIIVDAKSGVSGAGRKVETPYLYSELDESMQAYALKGHRHQPEIWQEWERAARDGQFRVSGFESRVYAKQTRNSELATRNSLIFVPQLAPMNRGIFAVLYAPLARKMSAEALREVYLSYYMREPFVSILGPYESPEVKAVAYTNHCQIGVSVSTSGHEAIVIAALDNLVKGAAGQAIQNMNLMFGLEETAGLL
jgi:N-acetyl-gamma-glutamyl-phosphate reductase